jgi:putative oxidoreductase
MNSDTIRQQELLTKGHAVYTSGQYLQSAVLLLFRFSYGWEMYLSGYRHLHAVDNMVSNFQDWGVPFPRFNVYVSGFTELTGGILLMLGLATRLISIPLVFNFLVAILTASKMKVQQALLGGDHLKAYNEGHLGGLEAIVDDTAFPFLMTSLATLVLGAGKVSIDHLIYRLWYQPRAGEQKQEANDM